MSWIRLPHVSSRMATAGAFLIVHEDAGDLDFRHGGVSPFGSKWAR